MLFVGIANYAAGRMHILETVPHNLIPALQLSETALTFKFNHLLAQPSAPDMMLLGSSLPMCAFYYAEGTLNPRIVEITKRHGLNLIQSYPEANFFRAEIKRRFACAPSVFNFTTAACMPSDARLLLMRIISNHRQPQVLVYGLGLRDFVDNINPPPGETPAFKALCDAGYLASNATLIPKAEAKTDLAISSLFELYRVRDQLRLLAEHFLCDGFRRQTNMERAFSMIAAERAQKAVSSTTEAQSENRDRVQSAGNKSCNTAMEPDSKVASVRKIADAQLVGRAQADSNSANRIPHASSNLSPLDYKQRYNPPNYKKLAAEMHELDTIAGICKEKGIKLVLINMPVSEGNKALSAPGLRQAYLRQLRSLAAGRGLLLVDFEEEHIFNDTDFLDTVHLSGYGAKKMIAILLDSLYGKRDPHSPH